MIYEFKAIIYKRKYKGTPSSEGKGNKPTFVVQMLLMLLALFYTVVPYSYPNARKCEKGQREYLTYCSGQQQ